MNSKLVVLATATGCIVAAGVGSYLAVRSTPSSLAAPAEIASLAPAPVPAPAATPSRTAATPASRESLSNTRPPVARADEPRSARTPSAVPAPVASPAAADTAPAPQPPQPAEDPAPLAAANTAAIETSPATAVTDIVESIEVPAEAVLGIRVETPVSSERSRVEDPVSARLTRDVMVGGRTAIPAGTEVVGYVSVVERGGRIRERARLGVRFTAIVLPDRTRIAIETPAIFREGAAKASESTGKIGASAVIGGILGGLVGGKRGAAIGGAAGAAGGTAVVMSGDRSEAALPQGTPLTLRLTEPVIVPADAR